MKQRTKYTLIAVFILIVLLIAGTLDYQDAKESNEYWKSQAK